MPVEYQTSWSVTGLLAAVGDAGARREHRGGRESRAAGAAGVAAPRAAEFSVELMADRTLAVYERVLARPPLDGRDATKRLADAATRTSSASSTRAP